MKLASTALWSGVFIYGYTYCCMIAKQLLSDLTADVDISDEDIERFQKAWVQGQKKLSCEKHRAARSHIWLGWLARTKLALPHLLRQAASQ